LFFCRPERPAIIAERREPPGIGVNSNPNALSERDNPESLIPEEPATEEHRRNTEQEESDPQIPADSGKNNHESREYDESEEK